MAAVFSFIPEVSMSKRSRVLLSTFALGVIVTLLAKLADAAWSFDGLDTIAAFAWIPFAFVATVVGIAALHWGLRAPDVVIKVTAPLTPLTAKFLEQDRRLEKRERLKGELFRLNGEIETFNAEMDYDTRIAWANRPGPYGK